MPVTHLCKLVTLEVTAFPPPSLTPLIDHSHFAHSWSQKRAQLVDNEELIEATGTIQVTLQFHAPPFS